MELQPHLPEAAASGPTVGREVVRALVIAVEGAGTSREDFFGATGLCEEDLSAAGPRLSVSKVLTYCQTALAVTGDPALGLHWGAGVEERDFGPVSLLLAQVKTLRHGFELLARFECLLHDEPTFRIEEDSSQAAVRMTSLVFYPPELAHFVAETLLAGTWRFIRSVSAQARPVCVHLAYDAPPHHAEYGRVFGAPVHFGQRATQLFFERALLDLPSPHGDSDMHEAVRSVAEERLRRLTTGTSYAARLRAYLLSQAPRRLSMEGAACALGMSGRSLRRQLAAEGISYRDVEHGVLELVAKRLLCDAGLTIQEAAHELGFSDTTSFHRAFKTWTGLTPSEFRDKTVGR